MSPIVYIIAGPNGAGKTTFARQSQPYNLDAGMLEEMISRYGTP